MDYKPMERTLSLVFTHMPGESYRTWLRSLLLLYLFDVFQALINSLTCWFCTSALGLILFQISVNHSLFKHHILIKVLFTMYSVVASWPADTENKLYNNFALHCLSYAYISQSEPRTSYQYNLVNGKPPQQQFSSVELKIIYIYAIGKPICAPPHLSEVPLTVPLKQFQFSSDGRCPGTHFTASLRT